MRVQLDDTLSSVLSREASETKVDLKPMKAVINVFQATKFVVIVCAATEKSCSRWLRKKSELQVTNLKI